MVQLVCQPAPIQWKIKNTSALNMFQNPILNSRNIDKVDTPNTQHTQ